MSLASMPACIMSQQPRRSVIVGVAMELDQLTLLKGLAGPYDEVQGDEPTVGTASRARMGHGSTA